MLTIPCYDEHYKTTDTTIYDLKNKISKWYFHVHRFTANQEMMPAMPEMMPAIMPHFMKNIKIYASTFKALIFTKILSCTQN